MYRPHRLSLILNSFLPLAYPRIAFGDILFVVPRFLFVYLFLFHAQGPRVRDGAASASLAAEHAAWALMRP